MACMEKQSLQFCSSAIQIMFMKLLVLNKVGSSESGMLTLRKNYLISKTKNALLLKITLFIITAFFFTGVIEQISRQKFEPSLVYATRAWEKYGEGNLPKRSFEEMVYVLKLSFKNRIPSLYRKS